MALTYFYPGWEVEPWGPLGWDVPPWPRDAARLYIEAASRPGELVVDAFAADPTFLLEAARLGRRAVGTEPNPILAEVARLRLAPPSPGTFRGLLQEVGRMEKVGRPLRDHLLDLYSATCPACQRPTALVAAAIWEGAELLEADLSCRECGLRARQPAGPALLIGGRGHGPSDGSGQGEPARGVAYWTLRERLGEELPAAVRERLLDLYPPRALGVLGELVLKGQSHLADDPRLGWWRLLLLHALARGHRLHPEPPRAEPWGSLRPPKRWREANLWLVLEEAAESLDGWAAEAQRAGARDGWEAPGAGAPDGPGARGPGAPVGLEAALEARGVWLGEGSLRHHGPRLGEGTAALVAGRLPNLNSPLFSLGYLWTCWLWDARAAAGLRALAQGRPLDAATYRRGLGQTLATARAILQPEGWLVLWAEGPLTGLAGSILLAAEEAGFELRQVLYLSDGAAAAREARPAFRFHWRPRVGLPRSSGLGRARLVELLAQDAGWSGLELLRRRAEAVEETLVRAAALEQWGRRGLFREALAQEDPEGALEEGFRRGLEGLAAGQGRRAEGRIELREPPGGEPLSQRIGHRARILLEEEPGLAVGELAQRLGAEFTGLESPGRLLLETCRRLYGGPG